MDIGFRYESGGIVTVAERPHLRCVDDSDIWSAIDGPLMRPINARTGPIDGADSLHHSRGIEREAYGTVCPWNKIRRNRYLRAS
jgi:hypothetical protein